jgi:O-antigen/teichoic acid export membrane protein
VDFGLFVRLLLVLMSVLGMVTAPLWPAIINARKEANSKWIVKSVRIAGLLILGAGVLSFLVVALFGSKILLLWTGRGMAEPRSFQVLFGIYFAQMAWSHFWGVVCVGFGKERLVAGVLLGEGIVILTLGCVLSISQGAPGMILGAVCSLAVVSNWIFPLYGYRAISRAKTAFDAPTQEEIQRLHLAEEEWV